MNKESLESLLNNKEKIGLLEHLMESTLETNEKFNLTAIKEEEKFRELMIYDSLIPLKYFDFCNKQIIDVGTGAGFPGLPLAICSDGLFTLLDSTQKKIDYINDFVKTNDINNAKGVCARAEDFARNNREKFDCVIARAVSSLPMLLELCIPMLKVNGLMLAMKSSKTDEEISLSKNALKKLDAEIINVYVDELPESKENRSLIVIKKLKPTQKKYPRNYNDIKSKTL